MSSAVSRRLYCLCESTDLGADLTVEIPISRHRAADLTNRVRWWSPSNLVPPGAVVIATWAMFVIRSRVGIARAFDPSTWYRYDSTWYMAIARHGYAVWHCAPNAIPPHLPPGNYLCGTVEWFPGYPLVVRSGSVVSGASVPTAALVVSWSFWFIFLAAVWRLLEDSVSTGTRWVCLGLFACSPGAIYFAAIFPISTTTAAMALCLFFAFRSAARWAPVGAFLAGVLAGCGYISAVVLCPALLVGLVIAGRSRWRPIAGGAVGVACGFGGVLLAQQLSVGIWDGYFVTGGKYARGSHNPFTVLTVHLRALWHTHQPKQPLLHAIAEQSAYTAGLVGLALAIVLIGLVRHSRLPTRGSEFASPHPPNPAARALAAVRARLTPVDAAAITTAVGAWVVAYSAGDRISVWRSEAFAVFGVLLLRRLPAWLLVVPLIAAGYVAWTLALFFFNGQLV